MPLCALIKESEISEIKNLTEDEIVAIGNQYAAIIDISGMYPVPQVGWLFDGRNIIGSGNSVRITKLALRNRFTFAEKLALQSALAVSLPLQAWFEDFKVATYIDLSRPETIAGITYLETAGLLASGRADVILNTPPTDEEKFKG